MKRIKKTIDVGESLEVDCEYDDDPYPIDDLINLLNDASKEGATHVKVVARDSIWVYIQPVLTELESDEEYRIRCLKEHEKAVFEAEQIERIEYYQYKRLKEKFDKQ